jgi:hypothetical protein
LCSNTQDDVNVPSLLKPPLSLNKLLMVLKSRELMVMPLISLLPSKLQLLLLLMLTVEELNTLCIELITIPSSPSTPAPSATSTCAGAAAVNSRLLRFHPCQMTTAAGVAIRTKQKLKSTHTAEKSPNAANGITE